MTAMTGTLWLVRLIGRNDRVRIVVWVLAIPAAVLATASSVKGLYPTPAELGAAAAALRGNASQIALNGPDRALDTLGGRVAFEVANFSLVGIALMSLLLVGRHTRGEEESGRAELVRAGPLGLYAGVAGPVLVVVGMNVAVGAAIALGLLALRLPAAGSLALGASLAAVGLVFAGVAALAAQAAAATRAAHALSGAALALAFALRALGDMGSGSLSWLSPLGWAQSSRPFAGERWWPLLLAVGVAGGCIVIAGALSARRDLGAGLIAPRPGAPTASKSLGRPLGLAVRLQRASLLAWAAGVFLAGLALGALGQDADQLVAENQSAADVLAQGGGGRLVDSFFATFLVLMALAAAGFALQSMQRLRAEEVSARAEAVLATAVSRRQWAGAQLAVALGGSVAVLAAAGAGTGLGYGAATADPAQVLRLTGAALVHVPAVWVLVGLAAVLFGLAPRAVPAAWGALAACLFIALLGQLLDAPGWVRGISPFRHVPPLPAAPLALGPLVVLAAVAAGLAGLGLAAFDRRDLG